MPNYDYECGACGERFESFETADATVIECRICGAPGAERKITGFGLLSRQPTTNQQRRMETKRGTDRGGARERFQRSLDRGRAKGKPPK